jgi:hypothetical protein
MAHSLEVVRLWKMFIIEVFADEIKKLLVFFGIR